MGIDLRKVGRGAVAVGLFLSVVLVSDILGSLLLSVLEASGGFGRWTNTLFVSGAILIPLLLCAAFAGVFHKMYMAKLGKLTVLLLYCLAALWFFGNACLMLNGLLNAVVLTLHDVRTGYVDWLTFSDFWLPMLPIALSGLLKPLVGYFWVYWFFEREWFFEKRV